MAYQAIFKRYEIKYMLTLQQKELLLKVMESYMALDQYGHTTIRNIYYDTENYRLIRESLEKPVYKEKLRIRSYGKAVKSGPVFVELKKKYKSVVYKRRMVLQEQQAMKWLKDGNRPKRQTQIADEIEYFRQFYKTLHPVIFLSYEREAFYSKMGDDFRVTFDENIRYREEELSLESEVWGTPILEKGQVLMELKTSGGIPLWMTHFLTQQQIHKISFSKYGTAYQNMIFTKQLGGQKYA